MTYWLTPETRYGLPPPRPSSEGFPAEVPWDRPIHELSHCWLTIDCHCGTTTGYPLRLMAARIGWQLTLRQVVPMLRCRRPECRRRPRHVELTTSLSGLHHDLTAMVPAD